VRANAAIGGHVDARSANCYCSADRYTGTNRHTVPDSDTNAAGHWTLAHGRRGDR
jgi:hypothetical protein